MYMPQAIKDTKQTYHESNQDPVQSLKNRMRPVVMAKDSIETEWENALYALIFSKEPKMELYAVLSCMPYHHKMIDKLDLLNAMANLGHFSRSFTSRLEMLDARLIPCLLEPARQDDDVYVIVRKTEQGWYAYNASAGGYETIEENSRIASAKNCFHIFKPFDESKTVMSRFIREITGRSWFGAVLSRFQGTFTQIFLIGLILNIFALAPPVFIVMIYDRVLSSGSLNTLAMLAFGMALAIVTEWTLRHLRSQSLSWMTARLDNIVGNRIFAHMLSLTPRYIENTSVTGQIARVRTFETARDFFSGGVFLSAIEMPFTVLSLIIIYLIAGPLVIIPIIFAIILAALFFIMRKFQVIQIRKSARSSTIRQQFMLETLESLATIKGNGMFDLWFKKFRQLSGRDATSNFRLQWIGSIAETLTQSISMIGLVALIGYGTFLIWNDTMSTGGLVGSMILIWRVLGPFQSLCLSIPRLEQLRSSIDQVNQITDLETEDSASLKVSKLPKIRGSIEFENVSMRYQDGGDLVYKDLSFTIEAGEAFAITGPAGTGKSTLFKIIQGMYPVSGGYVRIDNFDIRQIDPRDIRRQVSYIPQIHDFFQGSVIDNIRLSNPLATEQEVLRALEFSGALEDVMALENKLFTPMQVAKQEYMSPSFTFKLALARMHVQEAPIVLIDELPNQFQEGDIGSILYKAIDRMRGKRTLLFVTFRKDYLALSDQILTLNLDKSYKVEPVDVLFQ